MSEVGEFNVAGSRCDDCHANEQACAARPGGCCVGCTHDFGDDEDDVETVPAPRVAEGSSSAPTTISAPTSGIEAVLTAAGKSKSKRTQALASKVESLLADLEDRLADEHADVLVRKKAEEQRQVAQRRVSELEQQLRDAKAALRGPSAKSASADPPPHFDNAKVRAWAREAGMDCPPVGRVPQRVVDAYLAAPAS